jgi:serine/threonine protein kinase
MLGERREAVEARFEREARVLASLRSPNTVSVLDFGRTTDGRLFLVMELLDGLPLDRILSKYGPLPAARVIPILIGACRSLAEAHAAGIVHRDVKPANLMLCHEGDDQERVKLIDFGLVKVPLASNVTADGRVSGTPDYMAPEQARGGEVDGRTDLYALGATGFHLLTGRPVFREPSDVATLLAHQIQQPTPPSKATNNYVPLELEHLLLRCLAKEPLSRPSSAASLARALSAIELPERHRMSPQALREWWQTVSGGDGASGTGPSEVSTRTA